MHELYVGIVGAGNIAHCHALAYQRLANVHIAAVVIFRSKEQGILRINTKYLMYTIITQQ